MGGGRTGHRLGKKHETQKRPESVDDAGTQAVRTEPGKE
jgi:hypothetical protein